DATTAVSAIVTTRSLLSERWTPGLQRSVCSNELINLYFDKKPYAILSKTPDQRIKLQKKSRNFVIAATRRWPRYLLCIRMIGGRGARVDRGFSTIAHFAVLQGRSAPPLFLDYHDVWNSEGCNHR